MLCDWPGGGARRHGDGVRTMMPASGTMSHSPANDGYGTPELNWDNKPERLAEGDPKRLIDFDET